MERAKDFSDAAGRSVLSKQEKIDSLKQELAKQRKDWDSALEEAADDLAASVKAALMDEQHEHALALDTVARLKQQLAEKDSAAISAIKALLA